MLKLNYFSDINVPLFITHGVDKSISRDLCRQLVALAFQRKAELDKKGIDTDYFQLFTIKTSKYTELFTRCDIIMEQAEPSYQTEHIKIVLGNFQFNGRIYLIESWNGETKNVSVDDHYMTMMLPEEY